MSAVVAEIPIVDTRSRERGIDALRGLAILLMILDHSLIVLSFGSSPIRHTITRLAMPIFFIVSGHLVRKFTSRTLIIGLIGLCLPVIVPWIDSPNVLTWYALGTLLLTKMSRKYYWLIIALALTLSSNFFNHDYGSSYWPYGLWALMATGALIPRELFTPFRRLPKFLDTIGRRPLLIYVGHLLIAEMIVIALQNGGYYR